MYNSLYMEFLSPFINLTVSSSDYIKLLTQFKSYMNKPLEMVKERDIDGNPVGCLEDVQINFVHYSNFSQAKECWEKRRARINYSNLFVYMVIENEKEAEEFAKVPIENKYGFSTFEHDKSIFALEDFEKSNEVKATFAARGFSSYMNDLARRKLYCYDDTLGNRGAKTLKVLDILKLLNGERDFFR